MPEKEKPPARPVDIYYERKKKWYNNINNGGFYMWGMIATWRMALDGVTIGSELLKKGESSEEAIVSAIVNVENNPYFKSVGYGGLPNEEGVVELDAAFMDGNTLKVGAVGGIRDIANPIYVAQLLSKEKVNNFLVGKGAQQYALAHGFSQQDLLTERAKFHYEERIKADEKEIKPYTGHDTVGMCCLDEQGKICAATSTSGLFMKKAGRVGDSPLCGSGFYADSEIGSASATGLGEDITKGCLSYEIVSLMKTMSPQEACKQAIDSFYKKMCKYNGECGDISVVSMNIKGEWGAYTTIKEFPFVVATEVDKVCVYIAYNQNNEFTIKKASQVWLENYNKTTKQYILRDYD